MSSNLVTTVTLQDIIMLIQQIPLRNNKINGGDLNTRFLIKIGYPYTLFRRFLNYTITAKQIVIWLNGLLEVEPNGIQELEIFDENNLKHFIETMRDNYGIDKDVKKLLENPIFQN